SGNTVQRNLSMQMAVFVEPKVRVIQFSYSPEIQEATDNHNNSLIVPNSSSNTGMNSARGVMWNLGASLQYPTKNPGDKITKLRGRIKTLVQTRSEIIEIPEPIGAKEQTKTQGGRRLLFKGLKKNNERQYQVDFTIYHDGMDQQQFNSMMDNPPVRLLDSEGHEYQSNGGGGSSNGEEISRQISFYRRSRDEGGSITGDPAKVL